MQKQPVSKIAIWSVIIIVIAALLMLIFNANTKMPDKDTAQTKVATDYDELVLIVEYLLDLENQDAYIDKPNGTILIAYEYVPIEDVQVNNAIKSLLDKKNYLTISKEGNTVYFEQWRGRSDINCGLAYSLNGRRDVQLTFLTEVVALEQQNWFYCVCDYEEWRIRQP